jgi:hypothetical protein
MAALFILLLLSGLFIPTGAALLKSFNQKRRDKDRATYELTFPNDLEVDRVIAFLRNVSAVPPARKLGGVMTTAFELHADGNRIRAFIRLPHVLAGGIIRQLHGSIPGMAAGVVEEPFDYSLTYAVEVGMTSPSKPLDIKDTRHAADISTSILKSIDALSEGEYVVVQFVLSPARRQRPPGDDVLSDVFRYSNVLHAPRSASRDEVSSRRSKLSEPNYRGILRVGAHAKTEPKARQLVQDVRHRFAATASGETHWQLNRRKLDTVVSDIRAARAVRPSALDSMVQLSTMELAALLGWRIKGAQIAGLPGAATRPLAASPGVLSKGRVFGESNHPSNPRKLAVSVVDSSKHWHIVGRTGSGKTTLGLNLAAQIMQEGRGLLGIDPKGDLFNGLLDYVPRDRLDDVIVFDVTDTLRPVGLNLLTQGNPQTVASDVQTIFTSIYRDTGAVRVPETLYHLLITLMTTKAPGPFAFVDIVPLISPSTRQEQQFRKAIIEGLTDPYIKGWWHNIDKLAPKQRDTYFESLRSRIWQLNSRAEIRNIIGQTESSIDLLDIVKNNKLLFVNLKGLPEEVASLIGSMLINNIWHALRAGYTNEANPFAIMLDEFQHFVHSPVPIDVMLQEGRSAGAQFHLMHQGLDQLQGRQPVADGVMNNAVNKVVFQRGLKDASTFSMEFGKPVTPDDMKMLGKYEFMARVASEDGISPPFTGRTLPPLEPYNYGKQAKERSRARYGRSVADVNAALIRRRQLGVGDTDDRPVVGEVDWEDDA